MQFRNADRPLNADAPLQRTDPPMPVTQFVLQTIGWGAILAVPFLLWAAL